MPKPTYLLFLAIILLLSQSKLYQVVSLSRHGARFHVNQFGDGKDTKPLWGQLTAVGMRQHQRFGQILRKQYITNLNFLSPNYNKNQIQVYSTSFNRTLASIQSQLYGLYPPGSGPKITNVNKNLQIPPYSNKTDVEEQKYALPGGYQPIKIKLNQKLMYQNCPNYSKYQKQNFQLHSDEFNQMNVTYYPFFKKLAPMFNFSLTTASFYTMVRVMDVVNVDNYLGRALPFNFTQDDQTNVFHLANWYFYMASLDKNTIMLSSGKLQKIISVFDRRIQSPNSYPLKWTFLSGHDTDLFALHLALDLSSPTCIQEFYRKKSTTSLNCESNVNVFASNLIFELHSEDARIFYVKIRSNGKYVYLCGKKSTQCEYTIFKNEVKKSISTNIQDLCGKPLNTNEQEMKINLLSSILLLQKNKQKILSQF